MNISTHVIDIGRGRPVVDLPVKLERLDGGEWSLVTESLTNHDGRVTEMVKGQELEAGTYRIHFATRVYFEARAVEAFYPYIEIVFDVRYPHKHHHVPLQLSGFGYSTHGQFVEDL